MPQDPSGGWLQRSSGANSNMSVSTGEPQRVADQITVSVDSEMAELYRSASATDRRKLDLLVNLRLHDAARPGRTLQKIMHEVSRNAQTRGLTPNVLQSILDEE